MEAMKTAIQQAQKSAALGEVPIGAVIVKDGQIISRGYNSREKTQNATHHAEIVAINKACKRLRSWRLDECEIYVTLEPCPMCSGAIVNARIKRLIYAAKNANQDPLITDMICRSGLQNHRVEIEVDSRYEPMSKKILHDFFSKIRIK